MPAKIARSTFRPSFVLPKVTVVVQISLRSCRKASKAPKLTSDREPSGESQTHTQLMLPTDVEAKE